MMIIASLIVTSTLIAQDVPLPPKPPDEGPSLAVTMKFIGDELGSIGRVNYLVYIHDNTKGRDWTNKFSSETTNVVTSVAGCRIAYHSRETRDEQVMRDTVSAFSLEVVQEVVVKNIDQDQKEATAKAGHPEWTGRSDPPVFILSIKGKDGGGVFSLYEESLANRIAKALVHAVELCGGGKDPF